MLTTRRNLLGRHARTSRQALSVAKDLLLSDSLLFLLAMMSLHYNACFFHQVYIPKACQGTWIYVATVSKTISFSGDLRMIWASPHIQGLDWLKWPRIFRKAAAGRIEFYNGAHLSSHQPLVSSGEKGWHNLARLCAGSSKVMLQKNKARVVPFCMWEASKFRSNWVWNWQNRLKNWFKMVQHGSTQNVDRYTLDKHFLRSCSSIIAQDNLTKKDEKGLVIWPRSAQCIPITPESTKKQFCKRS